jgi:hypothetical protein
MVGGGKILKEKTRPHPPKKREKKKRKNKKRVSSL